MTNQILNSLTSIPILSSQTPTKRTNAPQKTTPQVKGNFDFFTKDRLITRDTYGKFNGKNFYIIHQIGSHFPFNKRFEKQYSKVTNGYISADGENIFRKSIGNYIFRAHWGEEQVILKGSYFCITNKDRIYAITNIAFDNDYEIKK